MIASAQHVGHASGISDTSPPAVDSLAFDHSPRRAFAAMSVEDKATWHIRYCAQEGAEPRVWVLVERVEREMRAAGEAVTVHSLSMRLVDRAARENDLDVRAAADLAGMAIGLRAG